MAGNVLVMRLVLFNHRVMPNKRVTQTNCGVIQHHLNKETKDCPQWWPGQPALPLLMHSKKNGNWFLCLRF